MNRDEMLGRITDSAFEWDFVVIGGGTTGMGIAVEAMETLLKFMAEYPTNEELLANLPVNI